ncbi:unnamed protein product, partial [Coregonus sp. 'balchen']
QCCLAGYVLLCISNWWVLAALYAGWLYLDRDTPTSGGRRSEWLRNCSASGFSSLFPGLTPYLLMLPFWFRIPFFRDYIMCGGLVSSEKASLSYLVSAPRGGNVAVVAVGGAPESLDARPGALTLQVLHRKGFIKLALKHG